MAVKFCPGAANISGTPTLKIKKCPSCGNEVELFSTDTQMECEKCGFIVYNNIQSCIRWCSHARECVGDEMYEKLMNADNVDVIESPLYHK
jgi:ribosomal protein S27AE